MSIFNKGGIILKKDNNCISTNQSASVEQCESLPSTPITTPGGATPGGEAILKVPVTLAELNVRTNISANIHFPEPVLEIKAIKKRVKIVQCTLLLPGASGFDPFAPSSTPIPLFIRGFVRKNIQYATPCAYSYGSSCVSSEIKSLTVDTPFECSTTIAPEDFLNPPQRPMFNSEGEFDFFRSQELGKEFPEKDHLLSSDLSQFHQESRQFYNQFPFCELLASRIVEYDEAIDRHPLPNHNAFGEGTFQTIVEKMFLEFTIKVLQNQQVRVNVL